MPPRPKRKRKLPPKLREDSPPPKPKPVSKPKDTAKVTPERTPLQNDELPKESPKIKKKMDIPQEKPSPKESPIPSTSKDTNDSSKKRKKRKIDIPKVHETNYSLQHVIRAHCALDDPNDDKTCVWACEFAPPPESGIVATCGGNSVVIIDCAQGKPIQKYSYTREEDEFFCLDFTSLKSAEGEKSHTILAVAGQRGKIRLLHPEFNICFHCISAHSRPVNTISFCKAHPNVLAVGCMDGSISIWDIGPLTGPNLETTSECIYRYSLHTSSVNTLSFSPSGKFLLSGGNDARIYEWRIKDLINKEKEIDDKKIGKQCITGYHGSNIDSISYVTESIIASKGALDGTISIWNRKLAKRRKKTHDLDILSETFLKGGHALSSGSTEQLRRKEKYPFEKGLLKWKSKDVYFLKLCVTWDQGSLIAGNTQGEIEIHDIEPFVKNNDQLVTIGGVEPKQILCFDSGSSNSGGSSGNLVRDVCVSIGGQFIVGVGEGNVIQIWSHTTDTS